MHRDKNPTSKICIFIIWMIYICFSLKIYFPILDSFKNWMMGIVIIILSINLFFEKERGKIFSDYKRYSFMCISFVILTVYKMLQSDNYQIYCFMEIFKVWLPIYIAYCLINVMDKEEVMALINGILFITFSIYFITCLGILFRQGIKNISFRNSVSAFESNVFPIIAMGCYIYYLYFNKNHVLQLVISALFVFLTFKRMGIIMGVFLAITSLPQIRDKKVPKIVGYIVKILSPLGVFLFFQNFIEGNADVLGKVLGWNLGRLSMGRNWILYRLLSSNYHSYGYYSSVLWINQDIEMDLVRILLELGVIALIITIFVLVDMGENNFYLMTVSAYFILQCLVGHLIDSTYSMIILFLAIGMIKTYGTAIGKEDIGSAPKFKITW